MAYVSDCYERLQMDDAINATERAMRSLEDIQGLMHRPSQEEYLQLAISALNAAISYTKLIDA